MMAFGASSGRCSCGDLADVSGDHTSKVQQLLTQVEVVVLCVTDDDEATDKVGEGCAAVSILVSSLTFLYGCLDIRMARAFLPFM
jgi:hypothetical protein